MARIKTQGTQVYAVIADTVVNFTCPKGFSFGEDSFTKIDATCLDSDTKDYDRGMRDPGEGSLEIHFDDENLSHLKLVELAENGDKVMWYVGSSHAKTPPTYDAVNGIELPDTRTWWSFEGYLDPAAPTIEMDSLIAYNFKLVRTSPVVITSRVIV